MRRQVSVVLVLAAWLLATGSQWDLAQTFAWGRMIASNSRSMPLVRAVKKTFDGEMCAICRAVADAKRDQDSGRTATPEGKVTAKIIFVSAPGALVFASPASLCVGLAPDLAALLSAEPSAPPSPPPRTLA